MFAVSRYWGNFNSSISGNGIISSMNTGIAVADLNWTWNEKPLAEKEVEIIKRVKKKYQELKLPFWWWVYPCGQSRETKEILIKEGFDYLGSIPCLAVDVSTTKIAVQENKDMETSFVQDTNELKIWEEISFAGFEMPQETSKQYNRFVASFDLSEKSPQKLFLAYCNGQPVATALLFLQKNAIGIYFVTTIAEHRNKGIALAMIMAIMKYAKIEGYKYCVLQSSKEGLNVYMQAGFKEYCKADVYSIPE